MDDRPDIEERGRYRFRTDLRNRTVRNVSLASD